MILETNREYNPLTTNVLLWEKNIFLSVFELLCLQYFNMQPL